MLPRFAAETIRTGGRSGQLPVAEDGDGLAAVVAISTETSGRVPSQLPDGHLLKRAPGSKQGYWHRAHPDLHLLWQQTAARGGLLKKRALDELLDQPLAHPGAGLFYLVTFAPLAPNGADEDPAVLPPTPPDFVAWAVSADNAHPLSLDLEPEHLGPACLAPQWPADDLASAHVVLVGAGSIGSAAARELAQYGVGRLSLVDPDRLAWHNLVRHTLPTRHVGRHKVEALAEELTSRWPHLRADNYALDVVSSTDLFRPLVDDADLVLCAADGVAARRVVSHIARLARKDAVLACVLMDGELGEVLRLRAQRREGCLLCRRAAQVESGAVAAEAGLDLGYGTGHQHRPMTAVGSDLHLVAGLAAKVSAATLLEARGHGGHQIAGEQGVLRLRGGLPHPAPFHAASTGDLVWSPADPPRPACPTCAAA